MRPISASAVGPFSLSICVESSLIRHLLEIVDQFPASRIDKQRTSPSRVAEFRVHQRPPDPAPAGWRSVHDSSPSPCAPPKEFPDHFVVRGIPWSASHFPTRPHTPPRRPAALRIVFSNCSHASCVVARRSTISSNIHTSPSLDLRYHRRHRIHVEIHRPVTSASSHRASPVVHVLSRENAPYTRLAFHIQIVPNTSW